MSFLRNIFGSRKPQRRPRPMRPTLETLEERVVLYGCKGLEFNITPVAGVPQQVVNAFKIAADQWSAILTDDIVVNVTIDFTASAAGLGQAASANTIKSLTEIRNALTADQRTVSDISAVAHLPAGVSASLYTTNFNTGAATLDNNGTDNNTYFNFPRAAAKAMGLRAANDPATDGVIKFRNISNFDYDRSDGIAAGRYDFIATATHEIGHLLGFVSGAETVDFRSKPNGPGYNAAIDQDNQIVLKPQDLFRFSAASVAAGANLDLRADLAAKYFSIDGGATQLSNFSTGTNNGDGAETHHWKDNLGLGVMDPTIATGEYGDVTALDVQVLDVIGWDPRMDFGDAPDAAAGTGLGNYQTTLGDNGPRHGLFAPSGLINDPTGSPKVYLGVGVNSELTPAAGGDNDDGIAVLPTFATGTTVTLTVASSATAAKPAKLNYFVDFNQNGVLGDAGESFAVTLTSASQLVSIVVPAGAALGNTFARFRISTAGGLGATGPANDGEVEDYQVTIAPSKVQIAGIVGGSQLAVSVNIDQGLYTGAGTLTAWNGQYYNLTVTSGTRQGTTVRLQGTMSPPGSTAKVAFTLDADSATGLITFSYKGAKGLLVTQTTIGTVLFQ